MSLSQAMKSIFLVALKTGKRWLVTAAAKGAKRLNTAVKNSKVKMLKNRERNIDSSSLNAEVTV